MRWLGNLLNGLGNSFAQNGGARRAEWFYQQATRFCPSHAPAWFNLGLEAKKRHDWVPFLECNQRAVHLEPGNQPAWWNLGIAATALNDFAEADRAWVGFGITVPPGQGARDWNLGPIPIRIQPQGPAEVVWCRRLDPARARITSIPLPGSQRAYGDTLLTDGAPSGRRWHAGQQVPVFPELEVLARSEWTTFGIKARMPSQADWLDLVHLAEGGPVKVEDWSNLEVLCKACSGGATPRTRRSPKNHGPWVPEHEIGLACQSQEPVLKLLEGWVSRDKGREHTPPLLLFSHAG